MKQMYSVAVFLVSDYDGDLSRWAFDIQTDNECVGEGKTHEKSDKDIKNEIQAIIRQITASVTFLPLLEESCKTTKIAFDIISCFYTTMETIPMHKPRYLLFRMSSRHV